MKKQTKIIITCAWAFVMFALTLGWPFTARFWNWVYQGTGWDRFAEFPTGDAGAELGMVASLWAVTAILLIPVWAEDV